MQQKVVMLVTNGDPEMGIDRRAEDRPCQKHQPRAPDGSSKRVPN